MKKLFALVVMSLSVFANAAGLKLENMAEVEVREVNKDGKEIITRIQAEKVVPGTQVIYTLSAKNEADQPLNNVVISDAIPQNMVYVNGSALGLNNPANTEIIFSVDGGNRYDKATNLKVKGIDGKERVATAEDYTHIRFVLHYAIEVGAVSKVSFRALLK